MLTAIFIIIVFFVVVIVHELGHFLAAKKVGIRVEEFGFGLPPRLLKKKIGETVYSLNALPIGGFVKLHGEDDGEDLSLTGKKIDPERAFFGKPKWQRALVLVAGVLMNFLLGVLVISFIFTRGVMVPTDRIHIEKVVEKAPAAAAGLESDDIILTIDGREIKKGEDIIGYTSERLGEELTLKIKRGETTKEVKITPRKDYPSGEGPMGVVISSFEEKKYPLWQAPIFGIWEALKLSGLIAVSFGQIIWQLISSGTVPEGMAGPVGIAQITSEAVKFGPLAVLELMGLISINLVVVNILPLPALDGGRLFFIGVEAITGRRVKPKFERVAHQAGFAFLIFLLALLTYNDLLRINIWEKIKSIFP